MSITLDLIIPRIRANFDEFANLQPNTMLHSSLMGYLYPNGGWYLLRFPINFDNFEWNLRIIRQIKEIEIDTSASEKYVDLLQLITRIKALEQRFKMGVRNLIDTVRNSNTAVADKMQKLFLDLFDHSEVPIDDKISPEKAQTEGCEKAIPHPEKEADQDPLSSSLKLPHPAENEIGNDASQKLTVDGSEFTKNLDEELSASIQMMPDSLREGIKDLILKLRQTDPNASEKLEIIFREHFERKTSHSEDGEMDLMRSLQVEIEEQGVSPLSASPPPPPPPIPSFLYRHKGSNPVVAKGNHRVSNQASGMNIIEELLSKGSKKKFDLFAYEESLRKLKEDRKEEEKSKDSLWGTISNRREVMEEERWETSSSSEWE